MSRSEQPGLIHTGDEVVVPQQRATPPREQVTARRAEAAERWDRVRWGPVWAGAVIAIGTFIVLQMLFFALGWLDLGFDGPNSPMASAVVSGILLIIAFFVGGLAAGGSLTWRGSPMDGAFNGVLVWALAVALIIATGLLGGASIAGSLGQILSGSGPQAVDPTQVLSLAAARVTAGWTVLFLGLTVAAAAMGAAVGTKEAIWSKREAHARTAA